MPNPITTSPLTLLAEFTEAGAWQLAVSPNPSSNGGWTTILLVRPAEAAKKWEHHKPRKFWLGWNGRRFAKSADIEHLKRKHPEVYQWLLKQFIAPPDQP